MALKWVGFQFTGTCISLELYSLVPLQPTTCGKPTKKSLLKHKRQQRKYLASQGMVMSALHTPWSMSYCSTTFLCSKVTLEPPTPPKT